MTTGNISEEDFLSLFPGYTEKAKWWKHYFEKESQPAQPRPHREGNPSKKAKWRMRKRLIKEEKNQNHKRICW